jgi:hypothetical protein
MEAIVWGLNIFCRIQQVKTSRTKDAFKLDFDNNSQKKIEYVKVKAHYIVHKMLS